MGTLKHLIFFLIFSSSVFAPAIVHWLNDDLTALELSVEEFDCEDDTSSEDELKHLTVSRPTPIIRCVSVTKKSLIPALELDLIQMAGAPGYPPPEFY